MTSRKKKRHAARGFGFGFGSPEEFLRFAYAKSPLGVRGLFLQLRNKGSQSSICRVMRVFGFFRSFFQYGPGGLRPFLPLPIFIFFQIIRRRNGGGWTPRDPIRKPRARVRTADRDGVTSLPSDDGLSLEGRIVATLAFATSVFRFGA